MGMCGMSRGKGRWGQEVVIGGRWFNFLHDGRELNEED